MNKGPKKRMDYRTAIAFAIDRFVALHPEQPDWLSRCTTIGHRKDSSGRFIVILTITPIATNRAFSYFSAAVNPETAETTVLVDLDPGTLVGEEYQGFEK